MLLVFMLLLLCVSGSFSSEIHTSSTTNVCAKYTSCETCKNGPDRCDWCASGADGGGTCLGASGTWAPIGGCPSGYWAASCCAPYKSCDSCASAPGRCRWCQVGAAVNGGKCIPFDGTGRPMLGGCSAGYYSNWCCDAYTNCNDCAASNKRCQWCETGSSVNGNRCIPFDGTGRPMWGGCDGNFFSNWCCRQFKTCSDCKNSGLRCSWCSGGTVNPKQCLPRSGTGAPMYEGCDSYAFSPKNYWTSHCCEEHSAGCGSCFAANDRCGWCGSDSDVNKNKCLVQSGSGGPTQGGCSQWNTRGTCGAPVPCSEQCETCDMSQFNPVAGRYVGRCKRCKDGYWGNNFPNQCTRKCPTSTCKLGQSCDMNTGEPVCYDYLKHVAVSQGVVLETVRWDVLSAPWWTCQSLCSASADCKSVTRCPGQQTCTLTSQVITGDTPQHDIGSGCQTFYKVPCAQPSPPVYDALASATDYVLLAALAYSDTPHSCLEQWEVTARSRYVNMHGVVRSMAGAFGSHSPIAVFGAVIPSRKQLVISFRGTDDIPQLTTEALWTLLPTQTLPLNTGLFVQIQPYFLLATSGLIDWVVSYLKDYWRPDLQLVFTGHSMGGAMASIAALWFSSGNQDSVTATDAAWANNSLHPWLYTFGQPRVGDAHYAAVHDHFVPHAYRLTHENDPVPHVPTCEEDIWSQCVPAKGEPYHHGTEVWYNNDMTNPYDYKLCCGPPTDEDASCSNSYSGWQLAMGARNNVQKHICYFGTALGSYCTEGPAKAQNMCDNTCRATFAYGGRDLRGCSSSLFLRGVLPEVQSRLQALSGVRWKLLLSHVISAVLGIRIDLQSSVVAPPADHVAARESATAATAAPRTSKVHEHVFRQQSAKATAYAINITSVGLPNRTGAMNRDVPAGVVVNFVAWTEPADALRLADLLQALQLNSTVDVSAWRRGLRHLNATDAANTAANNITVPVNVTWAHLFTLLLQSHIEHDPQVLQVLLNSGMSPLDVTAEFAEQVPPWALQPVPPMPQPQPQPDVPGIIGGGYSNSSTYSAVQAVCGVYLNPLLIDIVGIAIDAVGLLLSSFSAKTEWYDGLFAARNVVGLIMAVVAVVSLWARRLRGQHLLACELILETQVSSVGKFFQVVKVAQKQGDESMTLVLLVLCSSFFILGHMVIIAATAMATMWPYCWVGIPLLCVMCCLCCASADSDGRVELEHYSALGDRDKAAEAAGTYLSSLGWKLMAGVSLWYALLAFISLAGISYYGWLVPSTPYWQSLSVLSSSRPSVEEWVIHHWVQLTTLL